MTAFEKRIFFLGFGAVARCTLPILMNHIKVDPRRVTIMDFEPNDAVVRPWLRQGMTFVKDRVTPDNLGSLLARHLSSGDLLIDLARTSSGTASCTPSPSRPSRRSSSSILTSRW